jgi:large subunit ribosomal protein L15
VNLDRIQAAVDRGALDAKDTVDVEALVRGGVLRRAKDGVRLLGRGEIKVALQFAVHGASKSAIAAVEKAGGAVKVLAPPKPEAPSPASGG